jgi:hypothetical protein
MADEVYTATVYYNGDEIDYFEVKGESYDEAREKAEAQLEGSIAVTIN